MTHQAKQYPKQHFTDGYSELSVRFDPEQAALWFYMQATPRPCFTPTILSELQTLFQKIENHTENPHPVQYLIAASALPDVYNLGGDLERFCKYIEVGDRENLRQYAYACLSLGYTCTHQFDRSITTIALIQGTALGGGFEAALSCNIVIAEESAKIGFPEILFNLFPGMGAFTYLSRRIPMHEAERIIASGKQYSASELYELGAIDVLAEDGRGVQATKEYIEEHHHQQLARLAMQKAKMRVNPITWEELRDIADIWVDAALKTDKTALRVMQRLIKAQNRKFHKRRGIPA